MPEDFSILFLQGGATLQFAIVPMNLLREGARAGYVRSGTWGKGALKDAAAWGDAYAAWDGEPFSFTRMPSDDELEIRPDTRYLHVTSNETIEGIRMAVVPGRRRPARGRHVVGLPQPPDPVGAVRPRVRRGAEEPRTRRASRWSWCGPRCSKR